MCLFVVCDCDRAQAGAYFYPPGQGQIIVAATFTQAAQQFDLSGKFIPTARFRKLEATAYIEIGVTDWLTATVKPALTNTSFAAAGTMVEANATGSEIGARMRVATWHNVTLAIQAKGVLPNLDLGRNTALLTDSSGGADLRAITGVNFHLGSWPSFFDAGAGYRWHAGRPPGEWRGDAALGMRPVPRLLLLVQSFNTISDGSGRLPFARFRLYKLQASAAYDLSADWSVQLGVLATIAGVNAPAERGGLAAVWRRF